MMPMQTAAMLVDPGMLLVKVLPQQAHRDTQFFTKYWLPANLLLAVAG
jgi:hypothetical protein